MTKHNNKIIAAIRTILMHIYNQNTHLIVRINCVLCK